MLKDKLHSLNTDRSKVREMLVFCVEKKIFAQALVDIICNEITDSIATTESFTSLDSGHRLAVMYLLNDIFYNMPMSGMQDFGEAFGRLGEVFSALS